MSEDTFLEDDELPESLGTLEDLVAEIENQWADLSAAVRGLTDAEMCRPGIVGTWSIKDVFAHIAAWEEEGAKRIDQIANGLGESLQWPTQDEENAMNARAVEVMRERTLEQVVKRMEEAHQDLTDMLVTFGEELMMAKMEVPAAEWVPGWTYLHYQDHAPQIWGFKNARPAGNQS